MLQFIPQDITTSLFIVKTDSKPIGYILFNEFLQVEMEFIGVIGLVHLTEILAFIYNKQAEFESQDEIHRVQDNILCELEQCKTTISINRASLSKILSDMKR